MARLSISGRGEKRLQEFTVRGHKPETGFEVAFTKKSEATRPNIRGGKRKVMAPIINTGGGKKVHGRTESVVGPRFMIGKGGEVASGQRTLPVGKGTKLTGPKN